MNNIPVTDTVPELRARLDEIARVLAAQKPTERIRRQTTGVGLVRMILSIHTPAPGSAFCPLCWRDSGEPEESPCRTVRLLALGMGASPAEA